MDKNELADILSQVKCKRTRFAEWEFNFIVHPMASQSWDGPEGWAIQCSFERPDALLHGKVKTGYGRHWLVANGATETSIVKTAWLAMQQIVAHELMEAFEWRGERIFDPHKSLMTLAYRGKD